MHQQDSRTCADDKILHPPTSLPTLPPFVRGCISRAFNEQVSAQSLLDLQHHYVNRKHQKTTTCNSLAALDCNLEIFRLVMDVPGLAQFLQISVAGSWQALAFCLARRATPYSKGLLY